MLRAEAEFPVVRGSKSGEVSSSWSGAAVLTFVLLFSCLNNV